MKIKILHPAKVELSEAVEYYNSQRNGLGYQFILEISDVIERINQFPEAWQLLSKRTRRCRTNKFPYGVVYKVYSDHILIISIMHLSRKPNSWKNNL